MIKKWDLFHGQGAARWRSPAAKELFARSFLNIADKCFYAPLAPLALLPFAATGHVSWALLAVQVLLAGGLVYLGIALRHEALETLDEIHEAGGAEAPP